MALIEEMDRSGNWLFRWRSFLPLLLFWGRSGRAVGRGVLDADVQGFDRTWWWPLICLDIAMAGQVIRALCVGYTPRGTSGRNTKEGQVAESLNTLGMYSICRHPLYLGNLLMWLGIILYIGHIWFAVVFLFSLCALYYERIMFAEEQFLRGKFGQAYLDWSASVPAFWPVLGRWKEPEVGFSMRNVLKREYNGFFAVFVCFAWIDMLHGYRASGMTSDFFASPACIFQDFWAYALAASFACLHGVAHAQEDHQGP